MPKKPKAKIFPGEIQHRVIPTDSTKGKLIAEIAAQEALLQEQLKTFLACVAHSDSEECKADEKGKLEARGWKVSNDGWIREGVLLGSAESFEMDREAFALHQYLSTLRALSFQIKITPGEALPAVHTSFVAGTAYAEFKAYAQLSQSGRKSTEEAVFSALDAAMRLWEANRENKGRPRSFELYEPYHKVRQEFAAPEYDSMLTFGNRVTDWLKSRGK